MLFAGIEGVETGAAFRENLTAMARKYSWGQLDAADIQRIAAKIDAAKAKADAFVRSAPIALIRMARSATDVTTTGASWLGGAPSLGAQEWPRSEHGKHMHLLAQIALDDLPPDHKPPEMSQTGSLAFFIQTAADWPLSCRVIHIPRSDGRASPLPDNLPVIFAGSDWAAQNKGHTNSTAPKTFPRWAVEAIPLPQPNPNRDDAAIAKLQEQFPDTEPTYLSRSKYRETNSDIADLCYWDAAQKFANSLLVALEGIEDTIAMTEKRVRDYGERYQADLDNLTTRRPAFADYVQRTRDWAFAQPAWTMMRADDYTLFKEAFAQIRDLHGSKAPFRPFYHLSGGEFYSLDQVVDLSLTEAAAGPQSVYQALPAALRADIDRQYRLPGKRMTHQMFGLGAMVQTAVEEHANDHLLLQIQSDPMMGWIWGDVGVLQFWISTDDLAAGRWDCVELTIDAH